MACWKLAALLLPLVLPATAAAAAGERLCHAVRGARGVQAAAAVLASDRTGTRSVALRRAAGVCVPTGTEAAGPAVTAWSANAAGDRPRPPAWTLDADTRLGRITGRVQRLDRMLLAPAGAATEGGFSCFALRTRARAMVRRIALETSDGSWMLDVGRPRRVCLALAGAHHPDLVCFGVRVSRLPSLGARGAKGAGAAERSRGPVEMCTPALIASTPPPPPPGPTPPPGPPPPPPPPPPTPPTPPFSLRVAPAAVTVDAGARPALAAVATFPDGHEEDWTARVVWRSADEAVAVGRGSVGGAFVEPVGPGTTAIAAVDREARVASTDTRGDAVLTVLWTLQRITLHPPASRRAPGHYEDFTATGHFAGGVTRNLTQRVVWATSDPRVAVAANAPGRRSRVRATGLGTALVTAADPISGISTARAGNDAVLRVVQGIAWLEVRPWDAWPGISRFPGQSVRLTAIAHLRDGSTRNVTQDVVWHSLHPAIAAAPDEPGDRSRVDALTPGLATVVATDRVSGAAGSVAVAVLGPLQHVEVTTREPFPLAAGGVQRLTAIGVHAGGGRRNLTQEAAWTSLTPSIAAMPNAPGDRSRLEALSGGIARVVATDPISGISSAPWEIGVLGRLVGLEASPASGWPPGRIWVGGIMGVDVWGLFEGGPRHRLGRVDAGPFVLESADPTVLAPSDGRLVGVGAGTTTVTARHLATGIVSPPAPVTVIGELSRIALDPPAMVRGIGESEELRALGHYPPDHTELLTQELVYTSSDPSVVAVASDGVRRSRLRAVGPGTATITATDPVTGMSTAQTGDDMTLTVVPGVLARIEILPAEVRRPTGGSVEYTAIGHYPDGRTLNVTSQVTWYSRQPGVARAENPQSHRSRIDAVAPGTATIGATHPSGLDSADTGDGATMTVEAVQAFTLRPAALAGTVGETRTVQGVLTLSSGAVLGAEAIAWAWSDDPAVAWASWDGPRLTVHLAAPGTTAVHALHPASGRWAAVHVTVHAGGSPSGAFAANQRTGVDFQK